MEGPGGPLHLFIFSQLLAMPRLCPLSCVVGGGHCKQVPLFVHSDQMSVLSPLSAARLLGGPQQAPGLLGTRPTGRTA